MRTSIQYLLLNQNQVWIPTWTPAQLGSSLALWLDADDASTIVLNGNTVSQWSDKSGNNRHATQSTAANQPTRTLSGLNNRTVVTFDGTDDELRTAASTLGITTAASMAFVSSWAINRSQGLLGTEDMTNRFGFFITGSFNNRWNSLTNNFLPAAEIVQLTPQQPQIVIGTATNGSQVAFRNGTQQATAAATFVAPTSSVMRIGNMLAGTSVPFMQGYHSEIVVTNTVISTNDRQRLEGYFAWKWGLRSNLPADHPFRNLPPT